MKKEKLIVILLVLGLFLVSFLHLSPKAKETTPGAETLEYKYKVTLSEGMESQLKADEEDWFKINADITFTEDKGSLKSTNSSTSEAWLSYQQTLDANKDFKISANVSVAKFWESHNDKEAQVGIGLFVGKEGDGGKLVYESDLCVIAKEQRFVQGQMIKNRKGEDPVDVGMMEVKDESGVLFVTYNSKEKSLRLYFNDQLVDTQKIDAGGAVDWKMSDDDKFVIGIIGFSEKVVIDSNYPTISSITIEHN